MKKLLQVVSIVSAVAVALAFAVPGRAADKPEKPKAEHHQLTGVIDAIDAAASTVTVKGRVDTKTFKVTDKTKISTADKKEAALADLKAGDKVTVVCGEGDVATRIMPARPPVKKEKK